MMQKHAKAYVHKSINQHLHTNTMPDSVTSVHNELIVHAHSAHTERNSWVELARTEKFN